MTETKPLCEFCGKPGGMDTSAAFRRQGRRNQGAMSPQWAPAEWSETLQAVCCPPCFTGRFYQHTIKERAEVDDFR